MATEWVEWAGFLKRILKATELRAGDGDVEGLTTIAEIQHIVDDTMQRAVDRLRADPWNYSWAQIGLRLGITRQAAQQRFSDTSTCRHMDSVT